MANRLVVCGPFLAIVLLMTPQLRAELLGYWSADSTAGRGDSLPNDQGNDDLDGELIEASYSPDGTGHTGIPGDYAIEFEGFDEDYAVIPPTEETFSEITITAWVNGFPNGAWAGIVVSRDPIQALYLGFQDSTTDLAYVWNDNTRDTWGWVSEVAVPEEEWTFVALTVTEEEATVYAGPQGGDLEFASNEIDHFEQENFTEWRLAEDNCCGTSRNFAGLIDDVSIWNEALSVEQLMSLHTGTDTPLKLAGIGVDPLDRLNDGTLTDPRERAAYVHDVLRTWIGDSNLDGQFDSSDLVVVFTAGEYEDQDDGNSTWVTGDWNGDGDFSSSDLVAAFTDGGYDLGPRPALNAVPEPSTLMPLVLAGWLLASRQRRSLLHTAP